MKEMPTPSFLQNRSTDDNHEKMRAILPADIDLSEGGHAWNMTRPTALMAAELCEFILPQVIKIIFPESSYGEFLDGHAKIRNIKRRSATAAIGEITITGAANSDIPAGSIFYTAAINDEPSVEYETIEDATISEEGYVTVGIRCVQTGIVGNTAANTIIFSSGKYNTIESVTNEKEVKGGTEEEDDDSLIERIMQHDDSQGYSFSGSIADYKRWAMSTDGVGSATIVPATDDSGLVTIVITDSNGAPATEQKCEEVYNHIMRPDEPESRLAPINAIISVVSPQITTVFIKATVELKDGATLESVKLSLIPKLSEYFSIAMDEKEIKYTKIYSSLSATDGVNDFSDLQISIDGKSYGEKNISLTDLSMPTISENDIELTVGTI